MNVLRIATTLSICTLLAAPALRAQAPATASPAARGKELNALFEEIWQERLKTTPELASSLGDKRYDDRLSDYSIEAVNADLARGRGYIQRISEIDTAGLSEQDKLSADIMLRDLIDAQEGAKFKEWEMPVTQMDGFHSELPMLVAQLSFDNEDDYTHYIARLHAVPRVFTQNMTNMMLGMDDGRIPPSYLLEKTLTQVQTLATQKPEDSPFAQPIKKFPEGISAEKQKQITADVLNAIKTQVLPSYARFAKFLQAQYIPKGRKEPGVWSIPNGDAYYAYRVKQSTTLDKTPSEIHEIGLAEVKRDEQEMLAIAMKLGFKDLATFKTSLKTNPKLHPASKEQLLGAYRTYLDGIKPRLPELFGTLPKAGFEVIPVPPYIEKDQSAAYYEQGTPDGKRPGRVNVNTYNFADRNLYDAEVISYHEGIPGHHLQISISQELTGIPEFRKQEYYTAYTEGWGLYSERLGKDIGLYQDPYNDYGRLNADIWRAIRLVVDTGVHSKHWTRQQMVDYFHEHSSIDETNVQSEVDRYIAWPAQALGYKMGQLKFLELRERAKKALGPKFDIKAFHDVILDAGALPLDVVDARVNAWIAKTK